MLTRLGKVLGLCLLSGCAVAPPKSNVELPPLPSETMKLASTAAIKSIPATVVIPPVAGDRITNIHVTDSTVTLSWVSNNNYTVDGGPYFDGPWSAITNLTARFAVIPRYESNKFYRLNKSAVEIKKTVIGHDVGPFVGNNDISFLINDIDWSVSMSDDLVVITNDVITRFPITTAGMFPCVPLSAAVDVEGKRFYTVEGSCYYGPMTGPYTFREWELLGDNGYFTNIVALNQSTFGAFIDKWGDMIRLQSGGIVVQWKSDTKGYCFKYRSPSGVWYDDICVDIAAYASLMTIGQHPDGTVCGFIIRDSVYMIATVFLFEHEEGLTIYSVNENLLAQEGEMAPVVAVPDHHNGILFASRCKDPYYFWKTGESADNQFRKGSSFGVAAFGNDHIPTESPLSPDSYVRNELKQHFSEPISSHAAVLANGKLWIIRQEYNPMTENFDLVYAQPYFNGSWGERFFISQSQAHPNYRGGAVNRLTSYRNSSQQPNRILFLNKDSEGKTSVFEIKL